MLKIMKGKTTKESKATNSASIEIVRPYWSADRYFAKRIHDYDRLTK